MKDTENLPLIPFEIGRSETISLPGLSKDCIPLEMLWVAPGEFRMGGSPSELLYNSYADEKQFKSIISNGYWLGKYPVTQYQWQTVMKSLPKQPIFCPDCPIVNIDWHHALAFCEVLNSQLLNRLPPGYIFSLPTETQWEYACRAGTQTTFYNGNDLNMVKHIAWFSENSDLQIQPSGKKLANAWGFHDLLGNVSEWCFDEWGPYPNGESEDWVADKGYYESYFRVVRGGEYTSIISDGSLKCSGRIEMPTRAKSPIVGLRLSLRLIYDPAFSW